MTPAPTYAARVARSQITIGIIAIVVGALGLFLSRDVEFATKAGSTIGWGDYELGFMRYNPLSALLTIGVGALGVLSGVLRRATPAIVAAAVSGLMALQVLVQWRAGAESNLLAGTGRNFAFSVFLLVGMGATALFARLATRVDAATGRPDDNLEEKVRV